MMMMMMMKVEDKIVEREDAGAVQVVLVVGLNMQG